MSVPTNVARPVARRHVALLSFGVIALAFPLLARAASDTIDFNRDIQPILSENCYQCHGPDAKARKAKLRLDTKEGAFATKDNGITAIVPGKPDDSELVTRIFSADPDEVMPDPASHKTLTAAQKDLLKRWIAAGAPWAEHWAFVAPRRPAVPATAAGATVRNPIDAFILARLAREKFAAAPEAPREKLIRRVTLDLTGLPPTPAEVDAFLADRAPDAYEKLVDRLLASPRYGERMVWDWLDAARYADTNGYQGDPTRTMWPWRDWVIKAFNDNLPYDRFTVEQLAGDLLPNATREQKLATGFNRNHMLNNEGGSIPEESRVGYVLDRVDTTATVWLGVTLGCARCHDHKFDPFTQREYYQLSAYFNQLPEKGNADAQSMAKPVMSLATPEQEAAVAAAKAALNEASEARRNLAEKVRDGQPAWEERLRAGAVPAFVAEWHPLTVDDVQTEHDGPLPLGDNGVVRVTGRGPAATETLIYNGTMFWRTMNALRLAQTTASGGSDGGLTLDVTSIQNDGSPIAATPIETTDANGRRITVFLLKPPLGPRERASLALRLTREPRPNDPLKEFRLTATNADPLTFTGLSTEARAALALPPAERAPEPAGELTRLYVAMLPERAVVERNFETSLEASNLAEKAMLRVMVMEDLPKPRDTFILTRGAYDQHADEVTPGTPHILPPLPTDAPPNRLALATWLVSPENPLTGRVTVNRIWAMFFGTGFVKTAGDFGLQGEKPSHPELLDWLAREFVDGGWDVKRLVRLIVTSATYRQSSKVTPELFERDPENRLLARGARFRLPSWMLRDQALAASGLLVEKLGGPAVNGYQPPGIWEEATFGKIKYQQDHGDALYRRSVYMFWRRIVGPTVFFDTANRQTCTVVPSRTNTPLHALTTLNDTTYVEAARVLAEHMLADGGKSDVERIAYAFRRCTARPPSKSETAMLTNALHRLRQQYAATPADAKALVATGEARPLRAFDPVELAAYTGLANLLLNLDETLTKE
jgi:hypothetical protein